MSGAAQHEGHLRQTQAGLQRQQHSQRDAQLSGRADLVARFTGSFDTALSCESAGHRCSLIESNIMVNSIEKWNKTSGTAYIFEQKAHA
jgi:hypothetical protein